MISFVLASPWRACFKLLLCRNLIRAANANGVLLPSKYSTFIRISFNRVMKDENHPKKKKTIYLRMKMKFLFSFRLENRFDVVIAPFIWFSYDSFSYFMHIYPEYVNTRESCWNHLTYNEKKFFFLYGSAAFVHTLLLSLLIIAYFYIWHRLLCDAKTWKCNWMKIALNLSSIPMTLFGTSINHLIS